MDLEMENGKRPWRPTPGTHTRRVSLRLDDAEGACLDVRARAFGCSVPQALRLLISGYEPPVGRLDRDAQRFIWKQVRGIAVNINQLVRRTNIDGTDRATREEIAGLRAEVSRLVRTIRELAGLEP
jgi:hypothetical protein